MKNKVTNPQIADATKVKSTFFQNTFSQNRNARLPFTILFDITAIKIVVPATTIPIDPAHASDAIVCVIASTSASPEIIQRV